MTTLLPYPDYRPSGIDWLGEVPAHWDAGNIRRFAQMKTGHTPSRSRDEYWLDCEIPWFTLADVWQLRQGRVFLGETAGLISKIGLENSAAELLPAGTVVLSRTASVGFSGIMPRPMATSQDFWNWVCGPKLRPKFLWYQLLAMQPQFGFLVQGSTHKTIYQADAAALAVAVPKVEEQDVLVSFLDLETAEIDAFIADQEQLLGLLAERRAATISNAVTKGLDPSVPMKDSGVEWLGGVPAHWVVGRIASSVASAKNGVWGNEPSGRDDIRCVRVADFDRPSQRIHDRDVTYRDVSVSERTGRILRRGDLLLEKSGGGEKSPVGFVVMYDRYEPAVTSNFVARVELRTGMEPRFWTYVHGSNYTRRLTARSIKQSTGIQNLDQSSYFNEAAVLPEFREQVAIADYLDHETAELDAAIADTREAIALSRERRAALISAAVTGKIDVRGAA